MGEEAVAKVTDFCLAKVFQNNGCLRTDTLAGSWCYMAPEFFAADGKVLEYDYSVHVFSLALLFQAILLNIRQCQHMESFSGTSLYKNCIMIANVFHKLEKFIMISLKVSLSNSCIVHKYDLNHFLSNLIRLFHTKSKYNKLM